jgi:Nucleotidyltransferase of unknown function (DUF6036)
MLSREEILRLLGELSDELEARGLHGDLFLVGGAAMALTYSTRRATRDLDAIFEPKQTIYEIAQQLAERNGLPSDWLNDGVKAFLPGDDHNATVLFDRPGLSVRIASPRYLFAMKVLAARVERDQDDLRVLYRLSSFQSVDEALDFVQGLYPQQPIPPRSQYLLEELFPAGRGTGGEGLDASE